MCANSRTGPPPPPEKLAADLCAKARRMRAFGAAMLRDSVELEPIGKLIAHRHRNIARAVVRESYDLERIALAIIERGKQCNNEESA